MIKSVTERRKPPMGRRKRKSPRTETWIEIIKLLTAMTMLVKAIVDLWN
jgi:hypothetical protein